MKHKKNAIIFYIKKNGTLFIELKSNYDKTLDLSEVTGKKVNIQRKTYHITGTLVSTTSTGIIIDNWNMENLLCV